MNYTTSQFYWSSWDTPRIPTNQINPSQTLRCPGACDHLVPTYESTWVVLWLLFCRSAPSTFPGTWSTLKGPFRGVPSHRLYSEIDHIHLSEAQCVSHHLPQVDCHNCLIRPNIPTVLTTSPETQSVHESLLFVDVWHLLTHKSPAKCSGRVVAVHSLDLILLPFDPSFF